MIIGFIIAAAVVVGGISYKQARTAQKAAKKAADAMAGVLANKESNIEPIPVIYGERRVGGVRVYMTAAGGKKNEYLYLALALCEGEVESITDIEIDNIPITDGRFTGLYSVETFTGTDSQAASTLLQAASVDWTSDHRLRGVAYIAIRLKYDADAFSGVPDITAVVKGKKVYDPRTTSTAWSDNPALCIRDYLTNNRYGKGLPTSAINETAFAQAANDLDSFTATPYVGAPSSLKLFKTNIVLDTGEEIFRNVERMLLGCRGFLPYTQGQYSLKIDQATSSILTLTTDTIIGGLKISGSKKEDRFNRVVVKFPNPETDWQPDQAFWPDAGSTEESTYQAEDGGTLLVDEVDLDGVTNYYSARDIARILVLRSRNGLRVGLKATSEALDLTVGDVVSITHPTPGWTAKPFQVEEVSLNYDGTADLSLIEYDSAIYAYDPANEETIYPDTELPNPFTVSPPTNLQATETTVIADDGTLLPSLRLTWTAADDAFVTQYEIQWQRAQALTDYGSVGDEYTDSENWSSITLSPDTQLDYGSIDEDITTGEPDYNSAFTGTLQYVIQGVTPSANYNIRIRSYNGLGARSSFVTLSTTPQGDTDPPGIPDQVTAVGGLREVSLSWRPPTDPDYAHVEVWESTVNNFDTATKIAIATGDNYIRTGLGYDVTRYYWLKSADYSGNISDVSTGASATTLFVDSDAFSDEVNNLFSEAGAYGIEPVSSLPATGDFDGQIKYDTTANKLYRWDADTSSWTDDIFSITTGSVDLASFAAGIEPVGIVSSLPSPTGYTGALIVFNTSDNKLYRYTGTEWVASVPAADVDGALAADNFPSNLRPIEVVGALPTTGNFDGRQVYLTTDKKLYRYNGTAWTAKINTTDLDGTITALQIANEAVTNAKIAVDAIQGDVIAAGAITATKILDGAISELKLADDAVTEAKLANAAVTADIVASGAITTTKITDGAIETAKLAAGSITTAKIAAGAVTADEIAANAVTTAKINAGAVTADTISAGAITTAKIAAGAVTAAEIAANTITAAKIAAGTITATEIASSAITADKIAANAITSDKIQAGSISTTKLSISDISILNQNTGFEEGATAWNLDNDEFEIVADNPKTGTYSAQQNTAAGLSYLRSETLIPVTEGETFYAEAYIKYSASAASGYARVVIQAMEGSTNSGGASGNAIMNTVTTYTKSAASYTVEAGKTHVYVMVFVGKSDSNDIVYIDDVRLFRSANSVLIADGAVNADKIAANAVEAGAIVAGAISTDKLAANAVTTAKLAADSVTAGIIAAGAVSTSELAADAVTAEKIAAGTITSDRIKAGDIQGDRIAANTITGGLIAAAGIITSAAQIDDAVITNAKIENGAITTAKIGDLQVSTLKIGDNAVTIPLSAQTTDALTISTDQTWNTAQSLTIDATGDPVKIAFSIILDNESGSQRFCHVRLRKGASTVLIDTSSFANDGIRIYDAEANIISYVYDDTSGDTGEQTYYVDVRRRGTWTGTFRVRYRVLTAATFKK